MSEPLAPQQLASVPAPDQSLVANQYPDLDDVLDSKVLLEERLDFLCQYYLNFGEWDKCHDDLNRFLLNSSKKRKLILMPRGHLKTSIVTVGLTIQHLLKDPNSTILIANAVWDYARSILFEIKEYLTIKTKLPYLYGRFESSRWNQDEITIRQRKKPNKTPTVSTAGADKAITGQHYKVIFADDIVNRQTISTEEQRTKTKKFYSDLLSVLEPEGTLYIVGTRWHDGDLYGELLRESKDKFDIHIRKAIEDGKIIFPKKFNQEVLDDLKKEKGSFEFNCTPSETPILMGDFRTKPIEHVQVGDEIIGFTTIQDTGERAKLVRTRVKRTFSKTDHVLTYVLKSGRAVKCTKDHRWYTRRMDETHRMYAEPKVGRKLMFVCPVGGEALSVREREDWAYFAGLFDGEGSAKSGGALFIAQSQSQNPDVYASITATMERLGISYGLSVKEPKLGGTRKENPGNTSFWVRDSFNIGLNLIRNSQCAKSIQIADKILKHGKRFVREEDEIVDVKYDGLRTVHALETETGNYVAWGYASSNSQYMNDPIGEENEHFKQPMRYWTDLGENPKHTITVDLAISEKTSADYTVVMDCAVTKSNQLCVVEYSRKRMSPLDTIEKIFEMVLKYGVKKVGIEAVAYQKALIKILEEEVRKRNIFFEIIPIHQSKDKFTRIISLQPRWESGNLLLKQGMVELEEEIMRFPIGEHDDVIDALAMQLNVIQPAVKQSKVWIPAKYRSMDYGYAY